MLVRGHSGAAIELVDESTIRKSVRGPAAARLARQIAKQARFHDALQTPDVRTPRVLSTADGPDAFSADMEFVGGRDFVQFLIDADAEALDDFVATVTAYVRRNLDASAPADVAGPLREKLDQLAAQGVPRRFIEAARARCRGPVVVPVGACHGDLTLSNIIFKRNRLYLIDFLDAFVESPLQDVVKLRQDTRFGWSLLLYRAGFDATRVGIALRHLDRRVDAAFAGFDWYRAHYDLFQLVNLCRILPYATEPRVAEFVTRSADEVLSR